METFWLTVSTEFKEPVTANSEKEAIAILRSRYESGAETVPAQLLEITPYSPYLEDAE